MSPPDPEAAASAWTEGWYRHASQLSSPNFNARPAGTEVDLIVVHAISLPPGRYGGDEVQHLFMNQLDWDANPYFKIIRGLTVSSHFYIDRIGKLWQFVSASDRAWHAGVSSYRGRTNCNDFSLGIELEGLAGDTFADVQYETLISLCSGIVQRYPIRDVAGHEHIAPGRKTDPGGGFEWLRLQNHFTSNEVRFPG